MSIFGAMFSGVSGLTAQSNALGMIADNISNVNTIGYKATTARFSTLVTQNATSKSFSPGGVSASPLQQIDRQGLLQASSSQTDVAIVGQGFFVVNEQSVPGAGDEFLFTRAGSFNPDKSGFLRNTAGFFLMGWPTLPDGTPNVTNTSVLNSLQAVNVAGISGSASPTTKISLGANLPATASIGSTENMTVQIFDSLGVSHQVIHTFTKTASNQWDVGITPPTGSPLAVLDNSAGAVFQAAGRLDLAGVPADGETVIIAGTTYEFDTNAAVGGSNTAIDVSGATTGADVAGLLVTAIADARITQGTGTGNASLFIQQTDAGGAIAVDLSGITINTTPGAPFPAAILQATAASTTFTVPAQTAGSAAGITFNTDGTLASVVPASVDITYSNGAATSNAVALNFGTVGQGDAMTQFASNFTTYFITQNGIRFGTFNGVTIADDGAVSALFDNGQSSAIFKLPLVTFPNPNGLFSKTGNVFGESDKSGAGLINVAGTGSAGTIASGALEASTVDIATEFTNMIITQQAYSAAARIISVGDELLDEVIRIIR